MCSRLFLCHSLTVCSSRNVFVIAVYFTRDLFPWSVWVDRKILNKLKSLKKMWIALRRCLASTLFRVHCRSSPLGRAVFRWLTVSRKLNCICMTAQSDRPHVGIVGSGPAGFYTAQQILKVSSSKVTSCLQWRSKVLGPFQ